MIRQHWLPSYADVLRGSSRLEGLASTDHTNFCYMKMWLFLHWTLNLLDDMKLVLTVSTFEAGSEKFPYIVL